ncbi:MAG TPA: hypothetical protein VFH98_03500, partial [Candidatus Limnocylindria bacterium]|nr:hypothetical protein [Candidatus Limnocylindria bacterium]
VPVKKSQLRIRPGRLLRLLVRGVDVAHVGYPFSIVRSSDGLEDGAALTAVRAWKRPTARR